MSLNPDVQNIRQAEFPIDNDYLNRWSPRAFQNKPVPEDVLMRVFEAARWAASSYNEQPWRFLLARTPEDLEKFGEFLVPANGWAKKAPVLVLTLAKKTFSHNDTPNRVYQHDVGAASAYMALAATQNGLYAHGMAGFDPDLARATLGIPTDYDLMAMWAIGYKGEPETLPEPLQEREKPSDRRPMSEILMEGEFHQVSPDETQIK